VATPTWILYGANGYTGEMAAREARQRGLTPILAGRNRESLARLAGELGFEYRCFSLDDPAKVRAGLRGAQLVLHCAGPFSATVRPMIEACLAERVHYLDITGEIDVFEYAKTQAGRAREAGILVCPGVGFDVVPTDCVAATLKQALPDATHLALGFDSRSPMSRGSAKTSVEGMATGTRMRRDGRIVSLPLASRVRDIDFGDGVKSAVMIPWGDVSTAHHTTGIPNIEVYIPASPGRIAGLRSMDRWRPLLKTQLVQWWLKRRIGRGAPGPAADQRDTTPMHVWGEARNAKGTIRTARLRTANGYSVTVEASLGIVEHLLKNGAPAGYHTPSQIVGADFAGRLRGSTPITLAES
jgi:short subunit dehydrogenase-like uncharacterized protein